MFVLNLWNASSSLLSFFYFLQAFHKKRKHALCHKNCLRFQKQKIYVKDYHFIVWLNGLSRDLFIHHIRFTTHWQVRFRTFLFQLWRFKTLNNSHLSWFIQRSISYYRYIFVLSCYIKSIFCCKPVSHCIYHTILLIIRKGIQSDI